MAVEWTITIEGKNEFGDVCRKAVRIDKSWERLFDGDIGLSIEDGKTILTALQNAVVAHEAETYSLFRRVCPDCHTFRSVKDYTTRRIRTVFGTVEAVPELPSGHAWRLRAAEGNLPRSSDARTDGADSPFGKHDALPAGSQGAVRVPAD